MLEKPHKTDNKYVSCIKIDGVPILPPVITSAKRKELLRYKHQAVKLEKRLKRERELREYISRYYLPKFDEPNVIVESLEHKLSFLDEPTPNPTHDKNLSKLSCDLQVSQYTNNEFKVLTNFENQTSHIENVIEYSPPDQVVETFLESEKPRLIRSNSYVLETPSPLLLQHLKKCADKDTNELATSTPNEEQVEKLNLTKSEFLSDTESELKNISDNSTSDDVTVLSKDNETIEEVEENNKNLDVLPVSLQSVKDLSLNQNDQDKLAYILSAIPETYSKQILELLEKQKQEQTIRLNSYMKIKETYLTVGNLPTISDPPLNEKIQREQSVYYTPELFDVSPEKLQEINPFSVKMTNGNNTTNCSPSEVSRKFDGMSPNVNEMLVTPKSCIRRLFTHPEISKKEVDRTNWAAALIQSRIRGYLTRRLLRTERVQGLIQTIKDALICAMELHSENVDSINESDVELHRRLIQQVSAAVYTFHDVFFMTSVSERMGIIRIDRERLKEKLKRPRSKSSSASSRSSRTSRLT